MLGCETYFFQLSKIQYTVSLHAHAIFSVSLTHVMRKARIQNYANYASSSFYLCEFGGVKVMAFCPLVFTSLTN